MRFDVFCANAATRVRGSDPWHFLGNSVVRSAKCDPPSILVCSVLLAAGEGAIYSPAGGTHHGRPDWASGFCFFNDPVLAILGETSISDARVAVSCDKQFFPYSAVFEPGGPETNFVTPSYALDGNLISGVGDAKMRDFGETFLRVYRARACYRCHPRGDEDG